MRATRAKKLRKEDPSKPNPGRKNGGTNKEEIHDRYRRSTSFQSASSRIFGNRIEVDGSPTGMPGVSGILESEPTELSGSDESDREPAGE